MQITAQLSNLRISPRKVRLVSLLIKGMTAEQAKNQLAYLAKGSAKPIGKLLDSALANAQNNSGLVKENLFIKEVVVNEGRKLKRIRAKGFGIAASIQKKTSHIKIVLEEKVPGMKFEAEKKIEKQALEEADGQAEQEVRAPAMAKPEKPIRREVEREMGRGFLSKIKKTGRRFFRRKAV